MTSQLLTVRSLKQETYNTKTIIFEKEPSLHYVAGQFLTLIHQTSLHEIRRQYSFSSHPTLDAYPSITVKRIPNGEVSRWLFDEIEIGDRIHTAGASGLFTLPESTKDFTTLLLLSAGSGITPIFSLIKEALHFHQHLTLVLVYSNSSESSGIFLNELRALQQAYANRFTLELLFSDAKNLLRARLGKSILEELMQLHIVAPEKTLTYVCGPLEYRQMALVTTLAQGIPAENIHKEVFHTPLARMQPVPPDKGKHQVYIRYRGKVQEVTSHYPITILQAAKTKNIDLPYSCEAGRCGACAATCVSGEVWMSRNEVLTDGELKSGRVLTCTGYAVNGNAELHIA